MVPDYPRAHIAHLESLVAGAQQRLEDQRRLVERLERRAVDANEARALLVALEHHLKELQADLRMARRLAGGAT